MSTGVLLFLERMVICCIRPYSHIIERFYRHPLGRLNTIHVYEYRVSPRKIWNLEKNLWDLSNMLILGTRRRHRKDWRKIIWRDFLNNPFSPINCHPLRYMAYSHNEKSNHFHYLRRGFFIIWVGHLPQMLAVDWFIGKKGLFKKSRHIIFFQPFYVFV